MKKMYMYVVLLFGFSYVVSNAQKVENIVSDVQKEEMVVLKSKELTECLQNVWGIDCRTAYYLAEKFGSLLNNPVYHVCVDEFISKSIALSINFFKDKKLSVLSREDGVYKAPKQHMILFENPWIRVLWGSSEPGEHEDFHFHGWKSLMVIIEPTTYEITYANGFVETGYWPRGVYELGVEAPYACTNIGTSADECLRFEIK